MAVLNVVRDRVNRVVAETVRDKNWKVEPTENGDVIGHPTVGSSTVFGVQLGPGLPRPEEKRVISVWLCVPEALRGEGIEVTLVDPESDPHILLTTFSTRRAEGELLADLQQAAQIQKVPVKTFVNAWMRGRADVYEDPWRTGSSASVLFNRPDADRHAGALKNTGLS